MRFYFLVSLPSASLAHTFPLVFVTSPTAGPHGLAKARAAITLHSDQVSGQPAQMVLPQRRALALTWTCCTQTQCADSPRSQPPSWRKSSALGMCWGCELQCPSLWQHHWGDGWWWLEGNTWRRWRHREGIVPVSRCYVGLLGLRIKLTHLREPLTTVNLWCLVFLWEFVSVDPPPRKKCTYALTHNILQLHFQGVQRPFPQICFWARALSYECCSK